MKVGYIGVGNMGSVLATRLMKEHELVICDESELALERLKLLGATVAMDKAMLARECEFIFICLPTSDHVKAVIFGDGGLIEYLRPGSLLIDQSTGDPKETRMMASILQQYGCNLIDAPVSGGIAGAIAGTLTIMVGGSAELFARVLPLLKAISSNIFHVGDVGGGHVIKLVNNLMSCAQRLLTMEAMTLAQKNGIDLNVAVKVLNASGGSNAYLEKIMGPRILQGKLDVGFTLGMAHKDLRFACQMGIDSDVPMFFGNLTRDLYQLCIAKMGSENQVDTVAMVFDEFAKTKIVPEPNDLGLIHEVNYNTVK
jgi:3-hydroxyisobutyrate dehydrogenase